MLLLGWLAPGGVLGEAVALDAGLAEEAVARVADRIPGLSVRQTAAGILRIAVARTVTWVRQVSVARGLDPRDFALFAYGGAGGMLATHVARELRIPRVVVPPAPGNFSAIALLMSDLRHDVIQSRLARLGELTAGAVEDDYRELERRVLGRLRADGFDRDHIRLVRTADLRYAGQWFELNVSVDRPLTDLDRLDRAFRTMHKERYDVDMDRPTEITNMRVAGHGLVDQPTLRAEAADRAEPEPQHREMVVDDAEITGPVWRRAALPAGFELRGPAVIEEAGATTVVGPGWHGEVHGTGALLLEHDR